MKIQQTSERLQAFELSELFIEELGWAQPSLRKPLSIEVKGEVFSLRMLAQLAGAAVFSVIRDGKPGIAERDVRDAIERELAKQFRENLCIFLDREKEPTQSFWVWAKRGRDEDNKPKRWYREHSYFAGQPVDLFMPKLRAMFFELAEVVDGANLTVVKVAQRMQEALDVEKVTKKFFKDYQAEHIAFLQHIDGLADERERRWYASVLLNRLMFVWFLQKKRFLNCSPSGQHGLPDGNTNYLDTRLNESKQRGSDRFYKEFLNALFFEAFAKPEADRSKQANALCGDIPYLNGGLFLEHPLELDEDKALRMGKSLHVPDVAFDNLFALFRKYEWSLNDTPGGKADEINPDVLGYIFERYINVVSTHSQKDLGAYYTRPEITGYLAERAIESAVLDRINKPAMPELGLLAIDHASVPELLARMDDHTALTLVKEVLPGLKILDPAVGSGAFLVAAMKVLVNVYSAVVGRAQLTGGPVLRNWLALEKVKHHNVGYGIRRSIITHNLYGVDLLEGAAEIAKLRLFLALVASAETVDDLEPLPNIDFNLLRGNSLIGFTRVDAQDYERKQHRQLSLLSKPFPKILEEYQRNVEHYRRSGEDEMKGVDLRKLRDSISALGDETQATLNELLRDDFNELKIKYEQATWDAQKQDLGKPTKLAIEREHIDALNPFHWGLVFGDIMQPRGGHSGGFDIILANPPWEVLKPQAKEFFADYLPELGKNKMQIEEFEKDKSKLLGKDKTARDKYLAYESGFPHVSSYFRAAPEYASQSSVVNGKKTGSDINLYKLFLERCYYLLREGGHCGIVIPSGIYTDLGAKGLRELLFARTRIEGLFCFENRKAIFDGVHRSFKFVVLTFKKVAAPRVQQHGERNASAAPDDLFSPALEPGTKSFPAAFMRVDVEELARFPAQGAIEISVELVKRLSPDSLSVMEFKGTTDIAIAEKMTAHPALAEWVDGQPLALAREFMSSDDAPLFNKERKGLTVWEGKMFAQFKCDLEPAKWWISEESLKQTRFFERPDWSHYRLALRRIARNTDERTLFVTVLPRNSVVVHSIFVNVDPIQNGYVSLYLCSIFNSFSTDYFLRQQVTSNVTKFALYLLPVPRIDTSKPSFSRLVQRAARLICTTSEFDALAQEVGLAGHKDGATSDTERARLRAEIDGLVAHLYGLSEEEFIHILATFPLVKDPIKVAARNAYRDVARDLLTD